MAITFRTSLGAALTHAQMDENFSSVYFSSSIHNIPNSTSKELKLWFDNDTDDPTYHSVELPAPGGGTVTIDGNQNNRLLTATGGASLQGEQYLTFDGSTLNLTGLFTPTDQYGNLSIGIYTGINATGGDNVIVGNYAGQNLESTGNVAVGNSSLPNAIGQENTAIGGASLINLQTGTSNTAIGFRTAENVEYGSGNVYIGNQAGPLTENVTQNNKLYINNSADDTPLILGDFATGQVTFHSQVSASVFSGSFVGNGSALTGVSAEWDGTRNGNAEITGSLIVSGAAGTKVDFTKVAAISGSVFSGSFVGDGSGLTGIISNSEWDGTRNGNAEITGSFIVSGSSPTINLKGVTTIDENIRIFNPGDTSIGIGVNAFANSNNIQRSVAIGSSAGENSNGYGVTIIGSDSGLGAGHGTTYVGHNVAPYNKGGETVAVGNYALNGAEYIQGSTILGYKAAPALQTGTENVALGLAALPNLGNGDRNVAIGTFAGHLRKGSGNVYIGAGSGREVVSEDNQLYIDNSQRDDALIRGDFGERTLTLNAVKVFMPELLDIQQDYAGVMSLPIGALYKDGPFIMVRVP